MATLSEFIALIRIQLSASATILSDQGLEESVKNAVTELGWSLANPITNPTQVMWITKRAVRHACYILWVASAQKFKYKQVNLNQRFEHYSILIRQMDREYEQALNAQPHLFGGVEAYKTFGTYLNAGFVYDSTGRDMTYTYEDLCRLINLGE